MCRLRSRERSAIGRSLNVGGRARRVGWVCSLSPRVCPFDPPGGPAMSHPFSCNTAGGGERGSAGEAGYPCCYIILTKPQGAVWEGSPGRRYTLPPPFSGRAPELFLRGSACQGGRPVPSVAFVSRIPASGRWPPGRLVRRAIRRHQAPGSLLFGGWRTMVRFLRKGGPSLRQLLGWGRISTWRMKWCKH